MKARDLLRLARVGNALMAGLGAVVGGVVVASPVPWMRLLFAFLATAFVAAYGNTLNDLADRDLDRVAHPNRPLPSKRVTPKQAESALIGFASIGLVCAVLAGGYALLAFAAVNVGLLYAYERWLKTRGLAGNALVALLVASTFVFGAAATGAPFVQWLPAATLAFLAFMSNLGREVLKDVEDADADRGHRRTVALKLGPRRAAQGALFPIVVACSTGASFALHAPSAWWRGFPAMLLAAVLVLAAGGIVGLRRASLGQRLLKAGMAIALLAFLSGPLVPLLLARMS